MHDSIGASLAALLAHFTSDNFSLADVKRRIGEILMELRFLVDSSEPVDGDLNLVLSNVRHRMGQGVELAGIDLRWRADDLPKISPLTARDTLSIKLILMEALSNVMHHSDAKSAALMARYDEDNCAIMIAVQDDGRGFNVTDIARAGRGISNMRRRIGTISTGGELSIESVPGKGTIVRIKLRIPKSEIYLAPPHENAA
jgi:signal transduction histidine kinase